MPRGGVRTVTESASGCSSNSESELGRAVAIGEDWVRGAGGWARISSDVGSQSAVDVEFEVGVGVGLLENAGVEAIAGFAGAASLGGAAGFSGAAGASEAAPAA